MFFRDEPDPDLMPPSPHVNLRVIPFARAWTHLRFAAALWSMRPDVTFVPAHTLPFFFPGRAVVTVHDLGYRYFPQAHPRTQRLYLDWTTRYSATRATRILADSEATAVDLRRFYGTSAQKLAVVYPGVDVPEVHDVAAIRERYKLPERYFIFLGTLQPRKNISRLVQAYARWRRNSNEDIVLALAGGRGWLYDPAWAQGQEGVIETGYIDEADKGTLYAGAVALTFPSLYEGFGFPVLEAMHAGTPVIASNTSSLPELVGDAGLLVDPLDLDAIVGAMNQISTDMNLRQRLIAAGQVQVRRFNWEDAARHTLEVLEQAGSP